MDIRNPSPDHLRADEPRGVTGFLARRRAAAREARPDAEADAAEGPGGPRRARADGARVADGQLVGGREDGPAAAGPELEGDGPPRRAAAVVRRRRVPRLLPERRRRHPAVPLQPDRDDQQGRRRDLRRRRHPVQCGQPDPEPWLDRPARRRQRGTGSARPRLLRFAPRHVLVSADLRARMGRARDHQRRHREARHRRRDRSAVDRPRRRRLLGLGSPRRDPPARRRRRDAMHLGRGCRGHGSVRARLPGAAGRRFRHLRRRQPAGLRQARAPQGLPAGRCAGARLQRLLRARRPRHRPAAGSDVEPPASTGPSCAGRPRASCRSSATRRGSRSNGGSAPIT